jgi:hypothetical protein
MSAWITSGLTHYVCAREDAGQTTSWADNIAALSACPGRQTALNSRWGPCAEFFAIGHTGHPMTLGLA